MGWLKEPLLHFLLIGAGLFVLFYQVSDPVVDRSDLIVVTEQDIDQMAALWSKRWQRQPTTTELDGLIEGRIREEVLYREARAMGLEQDDTIVRRRMAQKMEFLFGDLVPLVEPRDEELQAFLQEHVERFRVSARYSFMHVFFNSDTRGDEAAQDAKSLLDDLRIQGEKADPTVVGDASLLGHHFSNLSDREVARLLGELFVSGLAEAPVGTWYGPVKSAYGAHLVFVSERIDARVPVLADIRDRVRSEWQMDQRREANEAMFQQLRARYAIRVERPGSGPTAGKVTNKP